MFVGSVAGYPRQGKQRGTTYIIVLPVVLGMLCNYCENQARGNCRFCGAGICRDHMRATRFVEGFEYPTEMGYISDYLIVDNAMWCGRCSLRFVRNHP